MIAYFEIDSKKSTDFDLYIDSELSFTSPAVKGEFVELDGVDGDPIISDGKLKNVSKSLPVKLITDGSVAIPERISQISSWLKSNVGWKDLYFSADPEYVYKVIYTDEYDFEVLLEDIGKAMLTFVVKPYKFLKLGKKEMVLGNSITNPTTRLAKSKITIHGTGNITLKIGTSVWNLINIDNGIVIDTLNDSVYSLDGQRSQWNKITTYPLPGINPGQNAVSITGTVSQIKIVPNWEAIV